MKTITPYIIAIAFAIYECLWRRWFGGGDLPSWLHWIDRRFFKHCVNTAAIFSLCHWYRGLSWLWSAYVALVMEILFWTLTFGMYFDIGHSGMPKDQEHIDAYNKPWFSKILNWCFPEDHRYTAFYDFCGMLIRYEWPLLLVFWVPTFDSGLIVLGELVALFYGLCWVMRDKQMLKNIGPTSLAEYLSGAATGLYLALNGTFLIK